MKTLANLAGQVCTNVGRDYSGGFATVVNESLNYAAVMAAILFEPDELKARASSVQLSAGNDSISLSSVSFTRFMSITTLYNVTDALPLWFVPFELWNVIIPSALTTLKFYTQYGTTIYFKLAQAANKLLDFYYQQYPAPMTASGSTLGFEWHEDYVVSVATGLVFASLEESESAANWDKAQQAVGAVMTLGGMKRQIIQGRSTKLQQAVQAMKGGQ